MSPGAGQGAGVKGPRIWDVCPMYAVKAGCPFILLGRICPITRLFAVERNAPFVTLWRESPSGLPVSPVRFGALSGQGEGMARCELGYRDCLDSIL